MKISRKQLVFGCALISLFLFRLAVGLSANFWYEDNRQIYLLGLKFYSTGMWPWFGPDVANGIQIPGALQSVLVAGPLFVFPRVESPIVFLNVLSFLSLCFFAWYCTRRLPQTPVWIVWGWVLLAPWTVEFSTQVVNPSYVLAGSILFFVGAFESYPSTRLGLIRSELCAFMMGFAFLWIMQLHMSWVVLPPFVAAAVYFRFKESTKSTAKWLSFFVLGSSLPGSLLIPTFLRFGLGGTGGTTRTIVFNTHNLWGILNLPEGILARFLSFSSFEVARFLGGDSSSRSIFLKENHWLLPVVVFLGIAGIAQPIYMIVRWFSRRDEPKDWIAIKYLTLMTVLLLYLLFAFSMKPPSSHTFYVTFPISMIYTFYCFERLLLKRRWQIFTAVFLGCGLLFHAGLAINSFSTKSLYINRKTPQTAIDQKDFRVLGERRPNARY